QTCGSSVGFEQILDQGNENIRTAPLPCVNISKEQDAVSMCLGPCPKMESMRSARFRGQVRKGQQRAECRVLERCGFERRLDLVDVQIWHRSLPPALLSELRYALGVAISLGDLLLQFFFGPDPRDLL